MCAHVRVQPLCCACCCALFVCRDKPRLISDGEKMALLYNIACCHSQLEDARSGLVALAGGATAAAVVLTM